MHEAVDAGVIVNADFVDGIIYSLLLSCQLSVMPATKPAEVYSVSAWYIVRTLSDVFWGEGYLILCWDRVFVWLCL